MATAATNHPAVYNPNGTAFTDLPIIYGFNNGGSAGMFVGVLIAANGKALGSHMCSHEGYMPHDLGILEGARPDRHDTFRAHYPDGYRMEFLSYEQARSHLGLKSALLKNAAIAAEQAAA